MQQSPETPGQLMPAMSNIVNNLNRRLRVLEERHSQIQRKTGVIEDNMLNNDRKVSNDVKNISYEENINFYFLINSCNPLPIFLQQFYRYGLVYPIQMEYEYIYFHF